MAGAGHAGTATVTRRKLRVFVVGRQALVRSTLSSALSQQTDLLLVGHGASLHEAIRDISQLRPNVVLLDAELLPRGGRQQIADVHERMDQVGLVVVGGEADEAWLLDAVIAGVSGYLPRHAPITQLLSVIRAVGNGELALPRALQRGLLQQLLERQDEYRQTLLCLVKLSRQEQRVLRLLADGLNNQSIADALLIKPHTARTHVQNILTKLGVHSRLEAAAYVAHNDVLEQLLGEVT